jgi:hypothetical protein
MLDMVQQWYLVKPVIKLLVPQKATTFVPGYATTSFSQESNENCKNYSVWIYACNNDLIHSNLRKQYFSQSLRVCSTSKYCMSAYNTHFLTQMPRLSVTFKWLKTGKKGLKACIYI